MLPLQAPRVQWDPPAQQGQVVQAQARLVPLVHPVLRVARARQALPVRPAQQVTAPRDPLVATERMDLQVAPARRARRALAPRAQPDPQDQRVHPVARQVRPACPVPQVRQVLAQVAAAR